MLLTPYPGPRPPQTDTIWVVVPFSRPENYLRVMENFHRQRFIGKRLLVVENGAAVGAFHSPSVALVIQSREHQSVAKNEALAFIRKHGGGYFAIMDDDDWYGPGYLDEIAGYAKAYDALGKQWHFVSLGEGLGDSAPQLLCCNRRYADLDPATWFTGGTISGWSETAEDFRVMPDSEDITWCEGMRDKGARLRALSIYHYLYRRSYVGASHTWRRDRGRFVAGLQRQDTLEFPLTKEGGIDLGLVTGEAYPAQCRLLGQKHFIAVDRGELSH